MRAFTPLLTEEGVELKPMDGLPPQHYESAPGPNTVMAAFENHPFDRDSLLQCQFPVFFAYGDLTDVHQEVWAAVLSRLLPDIHIRRFDGIYHCVAPAETSRADHARALRELWSARD